jgi:hypothetical protein
MLPGGSLRADDQKKKPHRLPVDRVERNGGWAYAADQTQLRYSGRPSVRNGDPEADPGTSTRLALLDRSQHRRVVTTPTIGQMPGKLGDNAALIPSRHRHDHLVRREQFGQEHGVGWDSMRTNLNREMERGNALV